MENLLYFFTDYEGNKSRMKSMAFDKIVEFIEKYKWNKSMYQMKEDFECKGTTDIEPDLLVLTNDVDHELYIQGWDFNTFSLVYTNDKLPISDKDHYFAGNIGFPMDKVMKALSYFVKGEKNELKEMITHEGDPEKGLLRMTAEEVRERGEYENNKELRYERELDATLDAMKPIDLDLDEIERILKE
ncbi:hypothetical protein [Flammeovirga aprica]|uniref:Uncharacterized protein n=1 Tax=Flammeovirga aprica JL-4 TaxID=694437 RepID=A0A7X9S219_9BACT|nr:hypothetical protein [Flammeovirga aprica]NME72932.1 hypothetical protein [Flammeovirga aprica JL-4]